MMMKTLLTASAAIALLAGGAHAGEGAKKAKPADAAATQMKDESGKAMDKAVDESMSKAASPDTSVNPPATDAYSTSTTTATPSSAMDATTAGADTAAIAPSRVTAMEPVADTPENRAKFKPLSRAGRATTPRGN